MQNWFIQISLIKANATVAEVIIWNICIFENLQMIYITIVKDAERDIEIFQTHRM